MAENRNKATARVKRWSYSFWDSSQSPKREGQFWLGYPGRLFSMWTRGKLAASGKRETRVSRGNFFSCNEGLKYFSALPVVATKRLRETVSMIWKVPFVFPQPTQEDARRINKLIVECALSDTFQSRKSHHVMTRAVMRISVSIPVRTSRCFYLILFPFVFILFFTKFPAWKLKAIVPPTSR